MNARAGVCVYHHDWAEGTAVGGGKERESDERWQGVRSGDESVAGGGGGGKRAQEGCEEEAA